MFRQPAVAGQFYSASPETLRADVARYTGEGVEPRPALAVISPHAGLMYSGHVAGAVYARVTVPQTVILIGPNHTGRGPGISVFAEGSWLIPGDEVPVDEALASLLLARFPQARADRTGHADEHCLEVQLPFLRHRRGDIRIVPIVLGTTNPTLCRELGACLAEAVRETERGGAGRPLLAGTTDMSHYESDEATRLKDRHALDAIRRLDPDALVEAVRTHGISMCGLGPTLAIMHAARILGASEATLIRYATSGDVSGDPARVVGYAGFVLN